MLAAALLRAEQELGAGIDEPILEVPKSTPFMRFIQLLAPLELFSAKTQALVRFTRPSHTTAPRHARDPYLCRGCGTPCSKLVVFLLAENHSPAPGQRLKELEPMCILAPQARLKIQ